MEYLLKSTAILSLCYAFYKLFLQRDTFFQSIRWYFMSSMILALSLPLIVIQKYIVIPASAQTVADDSQVVSQVFQESSFDWQNVLWMIYLTGVVVLLAKFVFQLSSLLWFIYSHKKEKIGGYHFVYTTAEVAPYSFFNFIVINKGQYQINDLNRIIKHEQVHASQKHSLDLLVSQLITIVFWFNPLMWLQHLDIEKNLEFIADEYSSGHHNEKKQYQYLLLKSGISQNSWAFTSKFYNSLIKKRISMLQQNRSRKANQLKFTLIIPILIAFVFQFNTEVIAKHKENKELKVNENITSVKEDNNFTYTITKDETKAGLNDLKAFLAKKGVDFKYSKLKYNAKNEIISISITLKNDKGNKTSMSTSSDTPIKPILIEVDNKENVLAVRQTGTSKSFAIHSKHDKGKNVFVKKIGGGEDVIFISEDDEVTTAGESSKFKFVTKDGGVIKVSPKGGEDDVHVWVSKVGDSTKMKNVKVMTFSSDDASEHVKVSVNENGDEVTKTKKVVKFRSSSNDKPLVVVDGVMKGHEELENIDPNNIKAVNVLKGDSAIKKYGEKAKNGVIEIETK